MHLKGNTGMSKRKVRLLAGTALILGGAVAGTAARAEQVCDATCQRLNALETEVKTLRDELAKRDKAGQGGQSEPGVKVEKKKLGFSSEDGKYEFEVAGRVMVDYTRSWAKFDGFNVPATPAEVAAGIARAEAQEGSGTELRRARLEFKGVYDKVWEGKIQIEYGSQDGEVDLKDVYVRYKGFANTNITIGNHYVPIGLDTMTSSKYITFMERSQLSNGLTPDRALGVSAMTHGENWTLAGGVFSGSGDINDTDEGFESLILAGRGTFAPIVANDTSVHLGFNIYNKSYNDINASKPNFEFDIAAHDAERFLHPALGAVDSVLFFGPEVAVVMGPWSLQGEYGRAHVNRAGGLADVNVTSWYVLGSWFITGGNRVYEADEGVFGRSKAKNALEVALRYENTDARDGAFEGGQNSVMTAGLNFYPNNHIVFKVNYVHGKGEHLGLAGDGGNFNGVLPGDYDVTFNAILARAQIDF